MKVTLPIIDPELRVIIKTLAANLTTGILDGSKIANLNVDNLVAGTITSETITLAVDDGEGDAYIAAGKTDFTNTDSGFILGLDDSDSNKAKFYIGSSSVYLNWTGSALTVVGATITGSTIQTATSGYRCVMASSVGYQLYNGATYLGKMSCSSSGSMILDTLDNIYFRTQSAEMMRIVSAGIQLPSGKYFGWTTGRKITDEGSWVSINGTFGPNGNETDDLGGSSTKWRSVYANKYYQQASTGGDASVYDFAYIEMGLLPKKMIKKHLGGIDGKGLMRTDKLPEKEIKLPFKKGTILSWNHGKLNICKKDMDNKAIAVANKRGLPIVLGAEPVRVIGKIKQGDFIVSANNGCGRSEKKPKLGTIIGKALQDKKSLKESLIKVMINPI